MDAGSLPRVAINLHQEVLAVNHLQPLLNVADANSAAVNLRLSLFGNAHAIVDDFHNQAALATLGTQSDGAAFNFRSDAMPKSVLNQRLQKHTGHDHIQGFRINLFADLQLVASESDHFNIQIIVDKTQLLLKRRKVTLGFQPSAENIRQLHQDGARCVRIKADERGDRVKSI